MHLFTETVGVLLDVLQLAVLLESFFFMREGRRWLFVPAYLLFGVGLWCLSLSQQLSSVRLLYTFIGAFAVALALYEVRFWQSIFVSSVFCVLYAVVDLLCMGILVGMGLSMDALMVPGIPRTIFVLLAHLLYLFVLMLIKAFSRKQSGTLRFRWLVPLLPGQVLGILYCVFALREMLKNRLALPLWDVMLLCALAFLNIVMVFYLEWIQGALAAQKDSELQEQQYQIQLQYYQRLHENQEETRALWHDIKKYLNAIRTVGAEQDPERTAALIQEAEQAAEGIAPVADVGNYMVNAILDGYLAQAQEVEANVQLDALLPATLAISPIDLYVILGNTLDNALDACSVLPKERRWLHIKLRYQGQTFFYQLVNPKSMSVKTKKAGNCHGYGIKNVQRCVQKYGGRLVIEDTSDQYTVTVRMNG